MVRKTLFYLSHLFNIFCILISIAYAIWFTSDGKFPQFDDIYNHYSDLSEAFLKGQNFLLKEPDPRLQSIADPHDAIYSKIPYLWDASYYKGKYYLYWGPVPVIPYMVWNILSGQKAPGQLGVITSYVTICISLFCLLYFVRSHYYPKAPVITIGLFTLSATISPPFLALLARPMVYETSILSGQCFLLLGIFFLFQNATQNRKWKLVLSGLCLGFSVLSRYTLVISVGVFVSYALFQIWYPKIRNKCSSIAIKKPLIDSALLLTPLVFCLLFTLGYNYSRFNNIFETGLKYQLTNAVPDNRYYSPYYVKSNLYLYLLISNPTVVRFPFVLVQLFHSEDLPEWTAPIAGKQYDMDFWGLLHSSPLCWFEAFSILALIYIYFKNARKGHGAIPPGRMPVFQITGALLLSCAFQFVFLLFYYYSALRFLSDFYLLMVLAGMLVWWELDLNLLDHKKLRLFFWGFLIYISVQTSLLGIFSGFTIYPNNFSKKNPLLYAQIVAITAKFRRELFVLIYPYSALIMVIKRLF